MKTTCSRNKQKLFLTHLTPKKCGVMALYLFVAFLAGCPSSSSSSGDSTPPPAASNSPAPIESTREISFPGAEPWQRVPRDQVASECGLDPDLLDAAEPAMSLSPYAIVRYGKLCWAGGGEEGLTETYPVNSATKTFGAMLFGIVAARTDVDENTRAHDWFTYTDTWADVPLGSIQALPPLNPDAKIFHILTSTGHNPVLHYGMRLPWSYDAVGLRGMNSLVPIMDRVIKAYPEAFPGSGGIQEMAVNELFTPLGMTASEWPGIVIAHTLQSNVYDMAKLGLLLLRKGRWGNKQIIDEDYVYRLSHPQIEDVHTGYGYLTWLNAKDGVATLFDFKSDLECSPFAGWPHYSHPPTNEAPDSNGGAPFTGGHDTGVFWADGAGGQFIYVHRGLDLVIVVRDDEKAQESDAEAQERGSENPTGLEYHRMWRLIRPALVALDPVYQGDEEAFCEAYQSGAYAPDLISPWEPGSGYGSVRVDDY